MNEPRHIPPPPSYPPTIHTPPPAAEPEPAKSLFAGIRPVWNLTAVGAAIAPIYDGYSLVTGAGTLLNDMADTGHPSGAWTVDIAVLAATAYLNHTRDGWLYRVLLFAIVLGTVLALPWLDAILRLMTGATT